MLRGSCATATIAVVIFPAAGGYGVISDLYIGAFRNLRVGEAMQ
jgi:hypothetical protein